MIPSISWLLPALLLILTLLWLYWLLIETEGVFLGQSVVLWLYAITAHRYDKLKQFQPEEEFFLVTEPILRATAGISAPLILDIATGTGRVPYNLCQQPAFAGFIVGLDGCQKMLRYAQPKLAAYPQHHALVQQTANYLPFPNDCFDLVCCLEALEFFPSDQNALQEMVRVLRPGGSLIVTRRKGWEGRLFLHRYRSTTQFMQLLEQCGLTTISCRLWQIRYDLYLATKSV